MKLPAFAGALCALALAASTPAVAAPSFDACTGTIASLPATITTQGTWCLKNDLSAPLASGYAITIETNNVTIDCNGFKLGGLAAGAATQARGIVAEDRANVTVRDCRVRGFLVGVWLPGAKGGHLVEDTVVEAATHAGMIVQGSGSIVRRSRILDIGGSTHACCLGMAVGLSMTGMVDILDNSIVGVLPLDNGEWGSGNPVGIQLAGGDGSRIIGNRVSDVVGTGIAIATSIQLTQTLRVDVTRNYLLGGGYGVMCESAKSLVYDNHISGGFTLATWQCGGTGNRVVD